MTSENKKSYFDYLDGSLIGDVKKNKNSQKLKYLALSTGMSLPLVLLLLFMSYSATSAGVASTSIISNSLLIFSTYKLPNKFDSFKRVINLLTLAGCYFVPWIFGNIKLPDCKSMAHRLLLKFFSGYLLSSEAMAN